MGNSIPLLNLTVGVFSSLNAITAAAKLLTLMPNHKPIHFQELTKTFKQHSTAFLPRGL
jgi:hypothetical protein